MSGTNASTRITLRIPGDWEHPGQLIERLPPGCRLKPEALFLADGTEIEFNPLPPDDEFPQIFRTSCRRPPARDELAIAERYTVNVGLSGPGGSLDAARVMMRAGAAIVQAGGAGVFIDNSALAHGGGGWISMADDGGPEALSFAFVAVVQGKSEVYTMGMQVFGLPNLTMRRSEVDRHGGDALIDILRGLCRSGSPADVGHTFETGDGPRFRAVGRIEDEFPDESPFHNPLGQLRLASLRSIAEEN